MPAQKLAFSQLLNGNLEWNYTSFLRHIGQKRFRETVFTPTGDYRENLRQTDQFLSVLCSPKVLLLQNKSRLSHQKTI